MKFDLISRFGQEDTFYVRDTLVPDLTDEQGRSVLDIESFRGPYQPPKASDPSWKRITDAFILRPGPALPTFWMEFPESSVYQQTVDDFAAALYLLTGKVLVSITK